MANSRALLVGNFTQDVTVAGPTPGGSVFYSGAVADALGLAVHVVSAAGLDLTREMHQRYPHWQFTWALAEATTSMRNEYTRGGRRQLLYAAGGAISSTLALPAAQTFELALLCPVFGEIDGTVARGVRARCTGASVQGWLRQVDGEGRIIPRPDPSFLEALAGVDAIFFSDEDVAGFPELRDAFLAAAPMVVETRGPQGALLHLNGDTQWITGTPVDEADPTGAGDTFAMSFLAHLGRHGDPIGAAHFACRMAAAVVLATGPVPPDILSVREDLAALWQGPT
jgi:sugar/nucleoside kinase (ribokinase family)